MPGILTPTAKTRMLEALLPDDVSVYLALLLVPDSIKEIGDPSYARAVASAWQNVGASRVNAATISWPALQNPAVARAIGLFDASIGGNLLMVLPTRTLFGEEIELVLDAGEIAQLPVGSLRIEVG